MVVPTEARASARPTVTLVTSDLKGSTALGEQLDPEALREVLNRYFAVMRAVFESHGGRIEKIIGDAIVAVFGLPEPAEDDALRAVEAAAESMRALATLNDELEAGWGVRLVTRTGVASGEVTFGPAEEGQHVLLGRTVDVSGVMEQNAPPLEVLLAESTYDLVREAIEAESVEPVSPKGSNERLAAYRLVSVRERETRRAHASAAVETTARDTRRTVSVVFALAKVHPTTGEQPGPGVLRDVMSVYFDAMRLALEHHGGTVEKYIGDAVMAVFGLPVRHEDDALRAVRAASDMQAALARLNDEQFRTGFGLELHGHIGVNTGEVIATGDATSAQRLVTGDTVNTAARLEQAAGAGEVVLGQLTRQLAGSEAEVEAIPPLALKGKAEPVPAYRLVRLGHRSSTTSATPFIGRTAELERLAAELGAAIASGNARLVTVVGEAGVGKSRLIREFAERAGVSATVLYGRCLPYGNGITFWPLNEAVGGVARIDSGDSPAVAVAKIRDLVKGLPGENREDRAAIVERVAAAISLSTAQFPVAELIWGARRLLEALARERPLVFIIDDLQSAEATFLELLDAVIEARSDAPIVLLCSARRELLERHPEWSQAHLEDTITLSPLSDDEAGVVVGELLGVLEPSVRVRIAAAAEGNPLYLEQIVSMLVETRAIERDGERWVARGGGRELAIPPTVQALVAARLDALGSEEREVIEPASVIGLSFAEEALAELVDAPLKPVLDQELGSLAGKELIRPVQGGEVVFRFGHVVIRDTAYGGLLKRVRAALHERFVVWAERVNRERGRETEFEEILGYHLEQAYRYRTELGVIDDTARSVGEQAAAKLSNAGRRALARSDMPAAANLLGRAIAVIPHLDPPRIELLLDMAEADIELGELASAGAAVRRAIEIADRVGDSRLTARCRLSRVWIRVYAPDAIEAEPGEDEDIVRQAIADLSAAGDEAGLARAWRVKAMLSSRAGQYDDVAAAAEELIEHAGRANELRLVARGASGYANQAVWSSQPVSELIIRIEGFLGQVTGDRKAEANISLGLAQLHAMQGDFVRARELYRRGQVLLRDLGPGISAMTTSIASARVEMLAGDYAAAEAELRRDERDLAQIQERYYRSSIAAALASVLLREEHWEEAEHFAEEAAELADPDDTDPQIVWRAVKAQVLAQRGEGAAALDLMKEAVTRVAETEDVILRADTLVDESEVLRRLGKQSEAEAPLRQALELYERKGDVVSGRAIRERIARPV